MKQEGDTMWALMLCVAAVVTLAVVLSTYL